MKRNGRRRFLRTFPLVTGGVAVGILQACGSVAQNTDIPLYGLEQEEMPDWHECAGGRKAIRAIIEKNGNIYTIGGAVRSVDTTDLHEAQIKNVVKDPTYEGHIPEQGWGPLEGKAGTTTTRFEAGSNGEIPVVSVGDTPPPAEICMDHGDPEKSIYIRPAAERR